MAWSYSFIVYCLPLYVNDVFDSNIKDVALISSIPVSVSIFSEMAAASLTDYFRKKKTIKISNVHKYFILFGQFSAVILLIIIAMWTNFIGSIICFTLIRVCFSFAEASYEALPIDMAMNYGSLIYAIATTAFSFGCLLNPTIMGYLVTNNTRAEWNKYFIFLCLFNVWGMIIYWIFGSGELQPWAKLQDETKTDSTA